MKKTLLSLATLFVALLLPCRMEAAPAHAEYYDSAAVSAWEMANFDPPTLWFKVYFAYAETIYLEETDDYTFTFNSEDEQEFDFHWDDPPGGEYQENMEYGFIINAYGLHLNAGAGDSGVAYRYEETVNGGVTETISQKGYWNGWPESVCYGMWGAGADGASGTARYSFTITDSTGAFVRAGNNTTTVTWGAYDFESDLIDGTTLPETTEGSVIISSWSHP